MNNLNSLAIGRAWSALLAICLLVGTADKALGQSADNSQGTSIGISLGHHSVKVQDRLISPLIYAGGQVSGFGLHFAKSDSSKLLTVGIEMESLDPSSPFPLSFQIGGNTFTRPNTSFTSLGIQVGLSKRFRTFEHWELWLGGNLGTRIRWAEMGLGLSEEDAYLFSTSLSPTATARYRLSEKQLLALNVRVPVLSLVSRPKFAVVDNEEIQHDGSDVFYIYGEGSLQSLNSFQEIDLQLTWTKSLSARWDFSVAYRFLYARYSNPSPFTARNNNIDLGLNLKF